MNDQGAGPPRGILIARLASSGQWDRLLEAARDWLSIDPENPSAHRSAAQALINLHRHEEAHAHLEKVLAARPRDDTAHRMMSVVLFDSKRFRQADESIQQAISINPNNAWHWYHLAWMCFKQSDRASGLKWATKARELEPNNATILNLYTLCLPRSGEKGDGIRRAREVLALDPQSPHAHNNLGTCYLDEAKDYREAEACFRRALAIQPTLAVAQRNLFVTLKHRDWIYRTLCAPKDLLWRFTRLVLSGRKEGPLSALFGLFVILMAARFVIAGFALWFALVWPLVKVYEFLTIGDIRKEAGEVGARRGGIWGYRRWSLPLRLTLFGLLLLLFWLTIYFMFEAPSGHYGWVDRAKAIMIAILMFGVPLALLAVFVTKVGKAQLKRFYAWRRRKRLEPLTKLKHGRP